jgi:hypothetical protein
MMDFPSSPTVGQQYPTVPVNGMPIYLWDGVKWKGSMSTPPYTKAEADAKFVDVSGDVMTGHLGLPTNPAATNAVRKDYVDAAVAGTVSKGYVDTQDALKLDKTGGTINGSLTVAGDLRTYRAGGGTGVVYLSSGDRYVYWDGTRYSMPSAPLGIGSPATGTDAARVDWVDSGYFPRGGGTINGPLTVTGEMIAATNYLRFVQSGGPGYIQYNGGNNYGLGSAGTIYHTGNLTPNGGAVTSVRLAYLGDQFIGADGMNESWGGGVVTGGGFMSDGYSYRTQLRYRQLQVLINGGWGAVGYV